MTRDLLVAPLKMLCPGILLKNSELDIDKNYKKLKKLVLFIYLLTTGLCYL